MEVDQYKNRVALTDFKGINFFCRKNFVAEWLNIDPYIPRPINKIVVANKQFLAMNHDGESVLSLLLNSQRYFYINPFFQSLHPNMAAALLKNIYQILMPGGIVRIAITNIKSILNEISTTDEQLSEKILQAHQHFFMIGYNSFDYDKESISELLIEAGFNNSAINENPFRQSQLPDIELLEKDNTISHYYFEVIK